MRIRIYSYNQGEGSRALSSATGWPRLRHEGSTFRPRDTDVIVNWGSSSAPDFSPARVLNDPSAISDMANKLYFFRQMSDDIVPEWTEDSDMASLWLTEGHTVVCRKKLTGHSGEGIELVSGALCDVPDAPLYTKYFKKKDEYRVHVVGRSAGAEGASGSGKILDVQQKKRKADVPDEAVDWKIRNLSGGFIYARQDIDVPERVREVALIAHQASGLDFGAYDVLWNATQAKAVVLEVNTAPGLTGTTVEKYSEALLELILAETTEKILTD